MFLWTAFLLGLLGSMHCAAMCGPLLLALPAVASSRGRFLLTRCVYHAGRLAAYGFIGVAFGLVGQTLGLAGWQRWVSLMAGSGLLLGLMLSLRTAARLPLFRAVGLLKRAFAPLLRNQTVVSQFFLGVINGFLPCGLVYAAAAGAIAADGLVNGIAYMLLFGLGTLPMMLSLGVAGNRLQALLARRFQRLVPISIGVMGLLLVCRSLALGIPYVSPDITHGEVKCSACEAKEVR